MTLSILLLLVIPLFLIPALFLSKNRLELYLFCAFPAIVLVLLLSLIDISFPKYEINEKIGTAFLPMWRWIFDGFKELNESERVHLSVSFTYLFFYFVCYFLFYIPMKFFYIGSNPNIHKPIKTVTRIFSVLLFFLSTYGMAFAFLASIRQILPFPDGFLSFLFNLIYRIEV